MRALGGPRPVLEGRLKAVAAVADEVVAHMAADEVGDILVQSPGRARDRG